MSNQLVEVIERLKQQQYLKFEHALEDLDHNPFAQTAGLFYQALIHDFETDLGGAIRHGVLELGTFATLCTEAYATYCNKVQCLPTASELYLAQTHPETTGGLLIFANMPNITSMVMETEFGLSQPNKPSNRLNATYRLNQDLVGSDRFETISDRDELYFRPNPTLYQAAYKIAAEQQYREPSPEAYQAYQGGSSKTCPVQTQIADIYLSLIDYAHLKYPAEVEAALSPSQSTSSR